MARPTSRRRKNRRQPPPAITPPASDNPFVLPGLPAFPGLKRPGSGTLKRAAKRRRRQEREYEEPFDAAKFAEQWNHSTPPPPLPPEDGAASWAGEWEDWMSDPALKAPESEAAEADPDLPDDDFDGEAPDWDLPDNYDDTIDYADNGTAARAAFRDRSGGRGILRATADRNRSAWSARSGASKAVSVLIGILVWVVVIGVVVLVIMANTRTEQPPTATGPSSTATQPAASSVPSSPWGHATTGCTKTRTPGAAVGAEPGSTATPVDAIFGFEWAYYVDRSAAKARAYTTAEAKLPPAETIQKGIDKQPNGTQYCVYLTQADKDGHVWNVELHEKWPGDREPQKYAQTITTARVGDRTLITAIAAK
ncbi:hypothetical protein [Nocardia sp. XZ_19_385]|uniref:hypothetical protein n=1 Tax=Nocardia sp. XZ_19_385 TaxID=2769488 RepID=UPI00188EC740|nr:hypothetical protein [Nocardia sp. XZ_19_385]